MSALRTWHQLGLVASRLMNEACTADLTLAECEVLVRLPNKSEMGLGQGAKLSTIAARTSQTVANARAVLSKLTKRNLVGKQTARYFRLAAGDRAIREYEQRLEQLESHLRRLWRVADEDSAWQVWKTLSDLAEVQPEALPADVDDAGRARLLHFLRLEFIQGNERRGRRTPIIDTVIQKDEIGPLLRLSAQALANSKFEVGTPVKIATEYAALHIRAK